MQGVWSGEYKFWSLQGLVNSGKMHKKNEHFFNFSACVAGKVLVDNGGNFR